MYKRKQNKADMYAAAKGVMSFLLLMDEVITQLTKENRLSSADNYRHSRRNFEAFLQRRGLDDIALEGISAALLSDYQEWLFGIGMCRNTVAFHMRNLRATYNKGLLWHTMLPPREGHPFEHIQTSPTPTRKRAAPADLLHTLRSLDIRACLIAHGKDPNKKTFQKMLSDLTFARDTFLFCFCACGLPFVDLAYLKSDNIRDGVLRYERHKTKTHIEMEILPIMQQYIDRYAGEGPYLFPLLNSTSTRENHRQYILALRRYNHQLATLSQMMGAGVSLSTYVARHSWATTVYHHNMPVAYISERMGHTSELTTRTYLKSFERSKIDDANKRIINAILE